MASSAAYQIGQTWRESQDTNALVRRAQAGDDHAVEVLTRTLRTRRAWPTCSTRTHSRCGSGRG